MDSHAFAPLVRWPDALKPRERLLRDGPSALSDGELLAILLRTGRRRQTVLDVARHVLELAGGLRGAAQLHPREWQRVPGVGPAKAATVMAALELGRRTWSQLPSPADSLDSPDAVFRHLAGRFFGASRESLWVVGLDGKNRPILEALVSAGTADRTPAHAREVFAPLLRGGAIKAVLAHNHPSGDVEPSAPDVELTRRVVAAGRLLGIPIVDHLIVAGQRFTSLRERGLCDNG